MTDPSPALPSAQLKDAIEDADLRVLLMVVFHYTGDRRWLEPPMRPQRDVRLIADQDAGLSPDARAEIRAAALEILSDPGRVPVIADPGNELMVELMHACLGEAVPPEYAPMFREEMGFCSRQVTWNTPGQPPVNLQRPVVIVGAGASGIALGANLQQLGVPYVILDKNHEVGGTWLENRYPGCGVDTPNHAYSFSFGARYPWTRYFALRDELQDYLERSASAFGLRPHIRFGTEVVGASWDAQALCWRVRTRSTSGEGVAEGEIEARALVSAIGQLSQASLPDILGAGSFTGPIFHSAHWPEGLDLRGKRVAIIGTGASAMQIVPAIKETAAAVTVYQRTAQWVRPIPRYKDAIGKGSRWLLKEVPLYAAWFRFTMLWRYGDGLLPSLHKDPDWPHPERALNRANDRHRQQMTEHMATELGDNATLLAQCLPDYPPYGKRILLDNGWYAALRHPNVTLVTEPIERLVANGVRTQEGDLREADIVVLATGFKVTEMAARLNIQGVGARNLREAWKDDNPTAHLGITVPGFPNLFVMQGPNTGLGHGGSAIFQSECQSRYIAGCLTRMIEQDIAAIEVRQDVHDAYVRKVDAEHEQMIWSHPGVSTYYRNRYGRVVSVSPWRLVDYWAMTHEPDLEEFNHISPAG